MAGVFTTSEERTAYFAALATLPTAQRERCRKLRAAFAAGRQAGANQRPGNPHSSPDSRTAWQLGYEACMSFA